MKIEFDASYLISNGITPNQYTIAYLISMSNHDLLNLLNLPNLYSDIEILISKGLLQRSVTPLDTLRSYEPTTKLHKALFQADFFEEFFMQYPYGVKRTWGKYDLLKNSCKSACEAVYNKIVDKNYTTHQHIIACLKAELQQRESDGSMMYIKSMSNWLINKEWLKYEHLVLENANYKQYISYGCDVE